MNAWHRVLVASAFIVTLVALGALEVLTARLPADQALTGAVGRGNEPMAPWQDFLNGQTPLVSPDYGPVPAREASESGGSDGQVMEAGGQVLR